MGEEKWSLVDIMPFVCIAFIVIGIPLLVATVRQECVKSYRIVEIGGCSKQGCGVKLENGQLSDDQFPILGKAFCVETKMKFFWQK